VAIVFTAAGRFRIHLPHLQGLQSDGQIRLESYWDLTAPYHKVEDAKRDSITIARKRVAFFHNIAFTPDQVEWEFFDDPDAPTRDGPELT
jgi:hypothetical protein